MSDENREILYSLERMDAHKEANPNLATELPSSVEMFAENKNNIERYHQAGITRISADGAGISHTQSKVALSRRLNSNLRRVPNAARRIERKEREGFVNSYVLPRGRLTYQQLIDYSNSFAADALAYDPAYKDFGMYALTAQFFAELKDDAKDLGDDTNDQSTAKGTAVGATADLEQIAEDSLETREDLNVAMKNHYRDNPAKLAEWLSASRIERPSGKNKGAPPAPEKPPEEDK